MATADSDSSISDSNDYSTPVLLGYASREPTDDAFSQLGGYPTWLDATQTPSATSASCRNCHSLMSLLLQLNGDLPDRFPTHERRLYVWGCGRKACRRKEGSVTALRGVRTSGKSAVSQQSEMQAHPGEEGRKAQKDIGAALFGAASSGGNAGNNPFTNSPGINPFATAPAPASSLAAKPSRQPPADENNLPQTFANKARITSAPPQQQPPMGHKPWLTDPAKLPKPYPAYHLDAEMEHLSNDPSSNGRPSEMYKPFIDDAHPDNILATSSAKEDALLYEDTHDKTFQRFADTIAQNPEQVVRYHFSGTPLLYARNDAIGRLFSVPSTALNSKVKTLRRAPGIPRCQSCGGERVFEMQLMPQAIIELEAEEDGGVVLNDGLEWGTVIVGVCREDCCDESVQETQWREEWVGVQWEEVVSWRGGGGGGGKGNR